MKRSRPLRRYAPLRPGRFRLCVCLRAIHRAHLWRLAVSYTIAACDGYCQARIENVCGIRATQGHHLLPRARGGADTPANCLLVCFACHRWIHEHPRQAAARGLLRTARNGYR